MTNAFDTARPTSRVSSALLNRALDLARRLFQKLARRSRMRRDEAFLLSQPDYILRDIGIGRSEIYGAIHSSRRDRDANETGYGTRR